MKQNDWESHKKKPEIMPYYLVRHDLSRAQGLLLRCNQIVIPEKLQKQVIKAGHSLGHFGMTRTKQMLRAKYWFPRLNSMVEETISKCIQCQITVAEPRQEPVKPSEIPETEWHTLSADFGGPYPDGHYNLVVIDKRTRFPVVEQTTSTSCRSTCDKLRGFFATFGIPERLETDNGPPFNSTDFKEFSEEMGFLHHRITPEHPRANGEAERFMKVLNKTEQIAHSEGRTSTSAIQYMLMGYRSTPHPATGYSPYEALMKRNVRTKLDFKSLSSKSDISKMEAEITKMDKDYKKKWVNHHRHPVCKEHNFKIGDMVLLKRRKLNKWTPIYEKEHYEILGLQGSSIRARRNSDGRTVHRDSSKFKRFFANADENWREKLLRASNGKQQASTDRREEQRDAQHHQEEQVAEMNQDVDGYQGQEEEAGSEHNSTNPQKRELPKRKRQLPSKFKDYIVGFKNRETEL